jgi:hypothetical protein
MLPFARARALIRVHVALIRVRVAHIHAPGSARRRRLPGAAPPGVSSKTSIHQAENKIILYPVRFSTTTECISNRVTAGKIQKKFIHKPPLATSQVLLLYQLLLLRAPIPAHPTPTLLKHFRPLSAQYRAGCSQHWSRRKEAKGSWWLANQCRRWRGESYSVDSHSKGEGSRGRQRWESEDRGLRAAQASGLLEVRAQVWRLRRSGR